MRRPTWPDWPNRCAVCRGGTRGVAGRLCADCLRRHAAPCARCPRCALARSTGGLACGACLRAPPPWRAAVALADYGYPWDGLLAALKFRAALDLVPTLAERLAERVASTGAGTGTEVETGTERGSFDEPDAHAGAGTGVARARPRPRTGCGAKGHAGIELVLPVPLSARRLRERGYNQAALLAARLAARLGLPCEARALVRPGDTAQQHGLPRERRAANVRGAFAVAPRAAGALHGRRVALVDDVMTTGATLAAATHALLDAGAAEVRVWVVARTPE